MSRPLQPVHPTSASHHGWRLGAVFALVFAALFVPIHTVAQDIVSCAREAALCSARCAAGNVLGSVLGAGSRTQECRAACESQRQQCLRAAPASGGPTPAPPPAAPATTSDPSQSPPRSPPRDAASSAGGAAGGAVPGGLAHLDIVGVRVGMNLNQAYEAVRAYRPELISWRMEDRPPGRALGFRFTKQEPPRSPITLESFSLDILFDDPARIVHGVYRSVLYGIGQRPSYDSVVSSLRRKYGDHALADGRFSNGSNAVGPKMLTWHFDAEGRPQTVNERCTTAWPRERNGERVYTSGPQAQRQLWCAQWVAVLLEEDADLPGHVISFQIMAADELRRQAAATGVVPPTVAVAAAGNAMPAPEMSAPRRGPKPPVGVTGWVRPNSDRYGEAFNGSRQSCIRQGRVRSTVGSERAWEMELCRVEYHADLGLVTRQAAEFCTELIKALGKDPRGILGCAMEPLPAPPPSQDPQTLAAWGGSTYAWCQTYVAATGFEPRIGRERTVEACVAERAQALGVPWPPR